MQAQMIDLKISLVKNKKNMQRTFGISSGVGAAAALMSFAFAGPTDLGQFGSQIGDAIQSIFNVAYGIITAAAALALLIAFAVRMAGNPQKAAQATDWIVRIVVCYVGLNCVALIFKIIKGATSGMNDDLTTITGGKATPQSN